MEFICLVLSAAGAFICLVLRAAGAESTTHEVKESHLGFFLNSRGRIRRWRNAFLWCQMRDRWHRKEQIKDEGKSSRLRPQAEQMQDSAAAGSSLRQDNRADCGRKKIRSINTSAHPQMYTAEEDREACGDLLCHASTSLPMRTTPPLKDTQDPSIINQMILQDPCLHSYHEVSYCSKYFFPNFALPKGHR